VVICVHVAYAQGIVIRVQQALRPDLGISIGSPILVVQQLLVIGICSWIVGSCERGCLSRGEDEVSRDLDAVPGGNRLARAGNRNRGRMILLAGTGSRSRGRRGLLARWLPDCFAEDV
jgi:hypothetical protein